MIELRQTETFTEWFDGLRDVRAQDRIVVRIRRLSLGNFGDAKSVGGKVMELRLAYGPGYRIYLTRQGDTVVILLCGGDKGSQRRDIARAHELAASLD